MNLTEQINQDMKDAMKGGRKLELETLRTIRAAILEFEKRKVGTVLTPDDELALLTAAAKKRKEAIELYTTGGRQDLIDQETRELEIIQRYLPAALTESEIEDMIRMTISATGAAGPKDFGKVMGPVMKQTKGRADGAAVQAQVKKILESM